MYDNHRGSEAVLLERCVLVGTLLVAVFEFGDEGLAQYPFTFAVDEDDAAAFLLEVRVHRVTEHLELVFLDVASRHAGGGFEHLMGVEVDFNHLVAVEFLCCTGRLPLWVWLFLLHGTFQFLSGNDERTAGLVVAHDVVFQCGLVEEQAFAERVKLVEFRRVDAQVDADGLFGCKRLVEFVGNELHTDALDVVEHGVAELLDEEFCIGFDGTL